ncbi:MAG: hypothetical protein FWF08_01860, partial [Oscillospiraceae bacterium]|nr:hypothetical protein [Oscillospiraceae bacterium]
TCVKGAICMVCGEEYTAIAPDNHLWSSWIPNTAARTETRLCIRSGCGASETRPVPAAGNKTLGWVANLLRQIFEFILRMIRIIINAFVGFFGFDPIYVIDYPVETTTELVTVP